MKNYTLIQFSFDGKYITDSSHETIEQCWNRYDNNGSKWYFYPFPMVIKGQTVKEAGGCFVNMQTGDVILNKLLSGKRVKTVKKAFEKIYKYLEESDITVDTEQFEDILIDYFRNN